ncbi:MAG: T9SS type A sorting domain-containing protein, partial [Ignavibacteriaceae bacterium]
VLNNPTSNLYYMGTFLPDKEESGKTHSDANVIYYKPSKFTFLSSKLIIADGDGVSPFANHPSYEFQLYNNLTGNKIIIYGIHLSSNGGAVRTSLVDIVRSYSDALPSGSYFIAAGDFNFTLGGSEGGYSALLNNTSGSGYFLDPLNISGDWNTDAANYKYQTWSTRKLGTVLGDGGSDVGLKNRFDIIFNSQSIVDAGGVTYLGSDFYKTYGNDGLHYANYDINDNGSTGLPNQAVSQTIADALLNASDHLPVYADYTFSLPTSANPPYQGSIAFTQVGVNDGTGSHPDEIEFVTLYRMNLTTLKITNNVINYDSTLGNGKGTFDLSSTGWTDVPAGTHIRLGPPTDNDATDGILSYDGSGSGTLPVFNSTGDNQVIAYTGSSPSPTYVAGLHWGGTSGAWPNPSFEPGTSSDIALGNYNNYYFNGTLTGTLFTDRSNLVDIGNWTGSATWQDYYSQPLPVELSSFSGRVDKDGIILQWRTETEVNNYGFDIERSIDNSNWEKIGFVAGHGNSNTPKDYSFTDNSSIPAGIIYYRLKQVDVDGKFEFSAIVELENKLSIKPVLSQNYPNPFNPGSKIGYTVPKTGFVSLKVYDVLGREVVTLVNALQSAGKYSVKFNGAGLASGIYFYILKTDNYILSKKMNLLK